jgi:hypothetical protein
VMFVATRLHAWKLRWKRDMFLAVLNEFERIVRLLHLTVRVNLPSCITCICSTYRSI